MLKFGVAFESLIQMSSIELVAVCISTNNITYTCHDHASYCRICIDCVLLCLPVLFTLCRRCSDDVIDDTDEELYYLQKCQASKTPLFISIQSHSLAPALFYCIRTTTFQLLHAAVVEPLSSA